MGLYPKLIFGIGIKGLYENLGWSAYNGILKFAQPHNKEIIWNQNTLLLTKRSSYLNAETIDLNGLPF